jgi:hypothetical protein
MARRLGRHRVATVNRDALGDVVRVIQHSQRAFVPSRDLAKNGESSPGRHGSSSSSFGSEQFSASGRDWQVFHHMASVVDDKQPLPFQIDLYMRITGLARCGQARLRLRSFGGGQFLPDLSTQRDRARAEERSHRQTRDISSPYDGMCESISEFAPIDCMLNGSAIRGPVNVLYRL